MPPADPTRETPQIYLITPPDLTVEDFPDHLARVLDGVPVACLRLSLATKDEERVARAADALREVAHARDVPLVIETHLRLVDRLGLDGVHLTDAARTVRYARKELGAEAIVGAFCGGSRHDGLAAGEAGADYIAFGPVGEARWEPARRPRTICSPGGPR
jgi:thiamine-phosphate pyrophosphorylase